MRPRLGGGARGRRLLAGGRATAELQVCERALLLPARQPRPLLERGRGG
jgi:hypothetical protein